MKFCNYCGAQLADNAKFCPSCGASLEINQENYYQSEQASSSQQYSYQQGAQYISVTPEEVDAMAQHSTKNARGIVGFIFGVVAMCLSFIPAAGMIIACGLGIPGLVISIVGLVKGISHHANKGLAIAGIILSVMSILCAYIWSIAFFDGLN